MKILKDFATDETGATAIEYGLVAALIGVAIIVGVKGMAGGVNNMFNGTTNKFETAVQ